VETKWKQKVETIVETTWKQSANKVETKWKQSGNKAATKCKQNRNKTEMCPANVFGSRIYLSIELWLRGSIVIGRKLKTACPKKGTQTQFATVDCFINGGSQAISDRTAPHGTSLVPCDLRSLGGGPRDLLTWSSEISWV